MQSSVLKFKENFIKWPWSKTPLGHSDSTPLKSSLTVMLRRLRVKPILLLLLLCWIYYMLDSGEFDPDSDEVDSFFENGRARDQPVVAFVKMIHCTGTGNQLFMYAVGYAFARSMKIPLRVERFHEKRCNDNGRPFVLHQFNIPESHFIDSKEAQALTDITNAGPEESYLRSVVYINELSYPAILENAKKERQRMRMNHKRNRTTFVFNEYFQVLDFFDSFRTELKEVLSLETFMASTSLENTNLENLLLDIAESSDSVALHVRRGDYVGTSHHTPLPLSYYIEAMEVMQRLRKEAHFFVFSDSIDWAESQFTEAGLTKKCRMTFVTPKFGLKTLEEFYVMGRCKHFIIPNSTFSWWAAYLNALKSGSLVVAPYPRFPASNFQKGSVRDIIEEKYPLYPTQWILVNPWHNVTNSTS